MKKVRGLQNLRVLFAFMKKVSRYIVQWMGVVLIFMSLAGSCFIICDLGTMNRLPYPPEGKNSDMSFSNMSILSDFKHIIAGSTVYIDMTVESKDNESTVHLGFARKEMANSTNPSVFYGTNIRLIGYTEMKHTFVEPGWYLLVTRKDDKLNQFKYDDKAQAYLVFASEVGYRETQERLTWISIYMAMLVAGSSLVHISRNGKHKSDTP